jgi:putative FmdB family regulatory protein
LIPNSKIAAVGTAAPDRSRSQHGKTIAISFTTSLAVLECNSRAALAVFLPPQILAAYFPNSENNCRSRDRECLFLEHFPPCALVAQLVHIVLPEDDFVALINGRAAIRRREPAGVITMPTYEFLCQRCHKMFDVVWSLSEYDKRIKEKHKCPACGSTRVVKTLSVVQVKTSKKS